MKKIFFLITLFSLLTTSAYSQWWVQGGNLLWPYGNVDITKGNLNLTGNLNAEGNHVINYLNSFYIKDINGNNAVKLLGIIGSDLSITIGDADGAANNVKLTIDENEIVATNLRTDQLILPNLFLTFDVSNPPTTSELDLIDFGADGTFKIIDDEDTGNYYLVFKITEGLYFFVQIIRA